MIPLDAILLILEWVGLILLGAIGWWALQTLAIRFGYWIRPYDMLAHDRRWRWQPPAQCCLCGRRHKTTRRRS